MINCAPIVRDQLCVNKSHRSCWITILFCTVLDTVEHVIFFLLVQNTKSICYHMTHLLDELSTEYMCLFKQAPKF